MPSPEESTDRTLPHVPFPAGDATVAQVVPPRVSVAGAPEVPGYAVGGEIARGGMGRVLAARDLTLDREVAIKILLPHQCAPGAAARFVRESKITAKLPHPGIPPVHALGTLSAGGPFLAMKLIRGRTLAELLRQRASPTTDLPDFVRVFEQVCQAVGFAHTQGVIHRDLKPANVMVGAFGEVQVMDWGLAKVLTSEPEMGGSSRPKGETTGAEGGDTDAEADTTRAGQVMGTPAYMAPEQARGETKRVDPRSDVFALGGILCAVLTGQAPFTGDEVLRRAGAGDLREALGRLDACSADAELVALAKQCLSAEPAARPRDGRAVADAVAAYRAGVEERLRAAEAERVAATAREAEGRRRRRWQRVAAAVFALLVVGGAAVAWWRDNEAGQRKAESLQQQIDAGKREQADRERAAANRGAIEFWLDRCVALQSADDAGGAGVAAAEIGRRLASGGADDLHPRIDRCRADLAMLRRLDQIDDTRWIALSDGKLPSLEANSAAWAAAFREYGIVPGQTPASEVAQRIKESPIRERLLGALDQWLLHERSVKLLALLQEIDPDEYRNSVRETIQHGIEIFLGIQALDERAGQQPARFALVLGIWRAVPTERREEILRRAHHRHPRDLQVIMTAAAIYPMNARHGAAERVGWYRAALALRPTSPVVWNNLAVALSDAGDRDGAADAYREAIKLDPTLGPAHYNLAFVLQENHLAAAVTSYREAIRVAPTFAPAHNNLADLLRRTGDLDGAAAGYREALRMSPPGAPERAVYHYNLGGVLRLQGKPDEALHHLREATRGGKLPPAQMPLVHYELGNVFHAKGEHAAAVAEFRKAVSLAPGFAGAHHNLGAALRLAGDVDGAVSAFREALRLGPPTTQTYSNLGSGLHAQGKWDEAIVCLKAALLLDAANLEAVAGLATVLTGRGDTNSAVALQREALKANPQLPLAHRNLAGTLATRGELDAALAHLKEAVRLDPKDAVAYIDLGILLQQKRDLPAAIRAFRDAIRLDPNSAKAHAALGTALSESGHYDSAITEYREAIRLDPALYLAHCNLGKTLQLKGDLPGAIAAYREATRHAPKDAMARAMLGQALFAAGDKERALVACREAVELAPTDADLQGLLGDVHSARGELDAAVTSFKAALRLTPSFAEAHDALGLAFWRKEDRAAAVSCFREAVRLNPRLVNAQYHLSIGLKDLGDLTGALAASQEAVRLDPKHIDARLVLGYLLRVRGELDGAVNAYKDAVRLDPNRAGSHEQLGVALAERGDLGGGHASLKEAIRLAPRSPSAHNNLGAVLARRGDLDAAVAAYKVAIDLAPKFADAHLNLGKALQAKGSLDAAAAAFKEAVQLQPNDPRAQNFLRQTERWRQLLPRLPDVAAGRARPEPREAVELAKLSSRAFQRRYSLAVRLYSGAFEADPKLAAEHRYSAACYAALAAAGKDPDLPTLGVEEWGLLTDLAYRWLRADLDAWSAKAKDAKSWPEARAILLHWKRDADLAAVRDQQSLAVMPEPDRKRWRALWAEVDALLASAAPSGR